MTAYPTGTVAFLFTDIEGSTRRWETRQQAMWAAVERHFELLGATITAHDGVLFKTVGDAVQAAFPTVSDAIGAAIDGQRALHGADWGDLGPLRVRMAIHVGTATPRDGDYLAPALNRLARVLSAGYGDQVLLTEAAVAVATPALSGGVDVIDLGAHRLRDLLQAEHIYQLRGPGLAAEFPPLKSLDRLLNNLPAQPTPLLGRETELAVARDLVRQDGVRLVTLTGSGGTGKTRLGVQAGAELLESFPDGVWFVPLAGIADPELVVPAIAQPLGVRETSDEPLLETLKTYLQSRQTLLLLDNFEHVTAAAPDVASLLAACPLLEVLATSREPLRIAAERELPVPPLSLPTARQARQLTPADLLEFSAIRLFVDRAQTVKPDFALTDANGADVAVICLRLDGLPLAIELAAARVRILPPAQLLARLDNRLKLLTGGNRDLPARQQTLRAAIEWSHDLLSADDRALFARLAVFAGGCTFEAAEVVCADAGGHALDVLDGLESLTQKSLLRPEDGADGNARFMMLETIREFGVERLEATGAEEDARQSHAAYFLTVAEEAEPELTGPRQASSLNRLETEHDNFRAALTWMERALGAEPHLRLVSALWRFWWMRGYLSEGRKWLDRALAAEPQVSPDIRGNALSGAGVLAESQGDYERAMVLHEEALALRRRMDDRPGIASSLTNLGIIAGDHGDYDRALELHESALAISEEVGDELGMSSSLFELGSLALNRGDYQSAGDLLNRSLALSRKSGEASAIGAVLENLGILAFYQEDYEQAARLYDESLELWRQLNDSRMIANSLVNLGEVIHLQHDLSRAQTQYREALAVFQELGDKRGTAFALYQLGKLNGEQGDFPQAIALFNESLALRSEVGEKTAVIESLEGIAAVASEYGAAARGVRIFGAAEAIRTKIGAPLPASYCRERDRSLLAAKTHLGEAACEQEWNRGQGLSLDEAVNEASALTRLLVRSQSPDAEVTTLM